MECSFIDRKTHRDDEAVDHDLGDGSTYRFYRRDNPDKYEVETFGWMVENYQFCQHVGRKYDVFECLNEWEWQKCSHLRANVDQLPPDVRAALPIQIR